MGDLTALLTRISDHTVDSVSQAVDAGGYGDAWLRVRSLDAVGLIQIELCDAGGMPRIDPALVHGLSKGGKRAVFVHVNHEARQAVVHCFHDGEQLDGWVGEPDALAAHLGPAVGRTLDEITAADDGTRHGIGLSASSTLALVRGRRLTVPPGLPTTTGSFQFTDLGRDVGEGDRVALVALDAAAARAAWERRPGSELAAAVTSLSDAALGPLKDARAAVVAELAALGDRTPTAAGLRSQRAFELVALGEALVHAVGDTTTFIDERFLPMFALSSGAPVFDDEDDDELEACSSILAAMVDVLPFASPQGCLLEMLGDDDVRPLAPWAVPGDDTVGSLFLLRADRLRSSVCSLVPQELALRVDGFYRTWWKESFEGSEEDFIAWRDGMDARGAPDLQRFLHSWASWRTCLEVAHANRLDVALVFYGG